MTSRIGNPDTEADRQLYRSLEQDDPKSFVMVAGAGSGKTTSLVKALDHLARLRGPELQRRAQQVACITYTKVAVGEIWGDVGDSPLFHVSTIHSFIWTVICPFQNDIREWVLGRIEEKIAEAREKYDKPRTQERTREKLVVEIDRLQAARAKVAQVRRFSYGTGSDYANGILGHTDIIGIGPALILARPLLCTLIAGRFPFVFVDESQDTNPDFVDALRHIAQTVDGFCVGFFGDPMQKIYLDGAGPIALDEAWNSITKPENLRCPAAVLRLINCIRAEDDALVQIGGRTEQVNGVATLVQGSARLFILPADDARKERLTEVRDWLAQTNCDDLWAADSEQADVRLLVLAHRMAAARLGFEQIYSSLNDNGDRSLKDGLKDGTAWVVRPFMAAILPLALSVRAGADFDVISTLRACCPLLSPQRLEAQDARELLGRLKADVIALTTMLDVGGGTTVREILQFVCDHELVSLDDRFGRFLSSEPDELIGEGNGEGAAVDAFFECPAAELWGYRRYVEEESPFATQQGVKGAEFRRVLVVLDDEESRHRTFSFGKYLGVTPLSDTDEANIAEGNDSTVARTRRLFYVCCSRAVQDLAVVWFVPDVDEALRVIEERGFFPMEDVVIYDGAGLVVVSR